MEFNLATIAGFMSTGLFTVGTWPMLSKAFRTKNLASYSFGNIVLSNVGNIIYSLYVFHLPPGPVWFLHSFNLLTTGLMLAWYLKYEVQPRRPRSSGDSVGTECVAAPGCCPSQ
jgi:uncharacterized protein with PQ loop repeat